MDCSLAAPLSSSPASTITAFVPFLWAAGPLLRKPSTLFCQSCCYSRSLIPPFPCRSAGRIQSNGEREAFGDTCLLHVPLAPRPKAWTCAPSPGLPSLSWVLEWALYQRKVPTSLVASSYKQRSRGSVSRNLPWSDLGLLTRPHPEPKEASQQQEGKSCLGGCGVLKLVVLGQGQHGAHRVLHTWVRLCCSGGSRRRSRKLRS